MASSTHVPLHAFWAAILPGLCDRFASLVIYKHVCAGLAGCGDIDALIAPQQQQDCLRAFASAARSVVPDAHVMSWAYSASGRSAIVLSRALLPAAAELDLNTRPTRLGVPFAPPERVLRFAAVSRAGIRFASPPAEAVILAVYCGLSAFGRPWFRDEDDRRLVFAAAASEPAAVARAAALLAPAPIRSLLPAMLASLGRDRTWPYGLSAAAFWRLALSPSRLPRRLARARERWFAPTTPLWHLVHKRRRRLDAAGLEQLLTAAGADPNLSLL
jgi:hypothetical protein